MSSCGIFDYKELMHQVCLIAGNRDSFKEFLDESFSKIGRTLDLSRVYYFSYNRASRIFNNDHEWVADGISKQKDFLQNIPLNEITWFYESMVDNKILKYKDIEDIDDENVKDILRYQDIKSIMVVPVYVENEYEGFIGFDYCKAYREWNELDEMILYTLAVMGAQGIREKKLQDEVKKKYDDLLSLVDNIGGLCYAIDIESHEIVYANNNLKVIFNDSLEGKTCYDVLQGKDKPCEFCTNKYILNNNDTYTWEYFNEKLNKEYHLIDKLIEMPNGKKVRFEVAVDITERKIAEKQLFEEKEFMNVTLMSIGDGVITTDVKGNILMVNKVAESILGYEKDDIIGKALDSFFITCIHRTGEICDNPVTHVLKYKTEELTQNNRAIYDKFGNYKNIRSIARLMHGPNEEVIGSVLVFGDITEDVKKDEQIEYLSKYDKVTNLYTRNYCESIIEDMNKPDNLPIAVVLGDVNGLKIVNDSYGHGHGDNVLKSIGNIINEACDEKSISGRWGGDEFIIIRPNSSLTEANEICRNIKFLCDKSDDNQIFSDSISLGYAVLDENQFDIDEVLKEAEDYMYKNKLMESKSLRSSVINSIQQTLHEKSFETEAHGMRLGKLSEYIGEKIGLSRKELDDLALVSMLHDIGKITVSNDILEKNGPLTGEEWKSIKEHSESGYRILKAIPELSHVAEYVLSHHERWDGLGYPEGLKEERIPILSRIISVVDAYDAMTNDRVYRKAIDKDLAVKEIVNNSGTQFDPKIVELFTSVIYEFNE
ncbi:MAG: diguanylate cyclase [Firmicutes bacterium]|jgi:diguanylate cyclase (GGDEF)-like protein/PAS domain S-box-containing protein|nr:diguanylate cyclase [Bacillota bacterium]